jgi:hypothetical protein
MSKLFSFDPPVPEKFQNCQLQHTAPQTMLNNNEIGWGMGGHALAAAIRHPWLFHCTLYKAFRQHAM